MEHSLKHELDLSSFKRENGESQVDAKKQKMFTSDRYFLSDFTGRELGKFLESMDIFAEDDMSDEDMDIDAMDKSFISSTLAETFPKDSSFPSTSHTSSSCLSTLPTSLSSPHDQSPLTHDASEGNEWIDDHVSSQEKTRLKISPAGNEPKDYFDLLFTQDFLEGIVEETNKSTEQFFLENVSTEDCPKRTTVTTWKPLSVEELKIFFGLIFHMGLIRIPHVKDYWSMDRKFSLSFFRSQMKRDRFAEIKRYLHFAYICNPEPDSSLSADPLHEIRPLIQHFHQVMQTIHYPKKNLYIDESMAIWKGRLPFHQWIKTKHKFGVKLYVLAEPDGLINRFLIYAGGTDSNLANTIVDKLLHGLDEGHLLFMGNFYNSITPTKNSPTQKSSHPVRTLRSNCKDNPPIDMQQFTKAEKNYVSKWKDHGDVLMISSKYPIKTVKNNKTKCVYEFNKYMSGVERSDQYLIHYTQEHTSVKWYKKLGLHIIELLLLNSYLFYQRYSGTKMNWYKYRLSIVDYLCPGPSVVPPRAATGTISGNAHFPDYLPPTSTRKTGQKDCRWCYNNKKVRRSTTICCPGCPGVPGLCLKNCFKEFHTLCPGCNFFILSCKCKYDET